MSRVAIITGAANGIGHNLTRDFIGDNDYDLVLGDVDYDKLRTAFGHTSATCHRLDVSNIEDWQAMIQQTIDQFGQIDLLCNVAGIIEPDWIEVASIESIDRHIDVNTKGVIYGTKLCAEQMVQQGHGHIINIASLAGIAPTPGISLYCASKHAVRGFSLALAAELRDKGVAVTCICPGLADTGMLTSQIDRPEAAISFTTGRPLTPQQVAGAIQKAIIKRPVEVCLPSPFLAKLVNAMPGLGVRLAGRVIKRGARAAERLRDSEKYSAD